MIHPTTSHTLNPLHGMIHLAIFLEFSRVLAQETCVKIGPTSNDDACQRGTDKLNSTPMSTVQRVGVSWRWIGVFVYTVCAY
uniref:Putative secreted protein n=1 Tax=Anopheles darlingi TaxID=43151 RepID=A0A2M4D6W2_ANODA